MKKEKLLLNNLLYIGEHLSCRNYMQHIDRGFKHIIFDDDTEIGEESVGKNYLIFQLTGKAIVSCNEFTNREIVAGDIILIPKASTFSAVVSRSSSIMCLAFDVPHNNCDKFILSDLAPLCKTCKYDFTPLKMRQPIPPLFEYAIYCFDNGMNCVHLHTHIEELLFFAFRGYYTREELARLFYPIIGVDPDFKDAVLSNLPKARNINDMIKLLCMGRTQFFEQFKANFGVTAKQYMLKVMDERILEKAAEPNITIKDLMYAFEFDSQSHFYHYVKQHFGCTPKELIGRFKSQTSINNIDDKIATDKHGNKKKETNLYTIIR
jgi:AraC-like DNA-binding protein